MHDIHMVYVVKSGYIFKYSLYVSMTVTKFLNVTFIMNGFINKFLSL